MKKYINAYILCNLCLMCSLLSCKKDEGFKHNAGQPITIERILPEKGSGGTQILINGSNFTADTSAISVSLNGRPLKVIGVKGNQLMVVVPKKAGSGPIVVKIGENTATSSIIFNYEFTRTVSTLAGSGVAGFANGPGTDAMFNFSSESWYRSSGIVVDNDLNVYVADPGNHCIRKIDSLGNVTTLAGDPNSSGYADGIGKGAKFIYPYSLSIDAQGNIYSVDPINWDLRKITPDGNAKTLAWANLEPWSIAVDKATGYICYTGNSGSAGVYRVSPDGTSNTQILSGINAPGGLVFDSKGNLYISVSGGNVIRKYTAGSWEGTTVAGTGISGYIDGAGSTAQFASPWGIGADDNDNIYVAGNGTPVGSASNPDQSIRRIEANTFMVTTFAGSGTAGYMDGIGKGAAFNAPGGVTVDKNGTVYVLDKHNNRIRKIISE